MPRILIYVSNEAYAHLADMGRATGFIEQDAMRLNGMSTMLNVLSNLTYVDSRPDFLKDADEDLLKIYHQPIWSGLGERRLARMITLYPDTIMNYVRIATDVGIFIDELFGSPRKTPTSLAGASIEALGLRFISPVIKDNTGFNALKEFIEAHARRQ